MGVINGIGNNVKDIYYDGKKIGTVYANGKVLYRSQTSQIVIDPAYNYYVFDVSLTENNTITLQEYRAGDATAWDGYTDWGDGTVDKNASHTYKRKGTYIVKTKWMINSVYAGGGYDTSDYKSKGALVGCKNINKNITMGASLFYNCNNMRYADLSCLNVRNIENMRDMFYHCFSLNKLNLDGWDTSNVQNMSAMFDQCWKLKPQVSHFNTSKVTNMSAMFFECDAVDGSDFKNWDTSNVEGMASMFYGTTIEDSSFLSDWDVSKVSVISQMFYGATIMDRLDLSRWDVSNCGGFMYTFAKCKANYGIDISNWDITDDVLVNNYYIHTMFVDMKCGDDTCSDIEHHVTHVGVSDEIWQEITKYM